MPGQTASKPATALLVIDVQQELFHKSKPVYQAESLLQNLCLLVERARQAGAPVFFVQHSSDKILVKGTDGWQFHPRLPVLPADPVIHKRHGSAFEDTPLVDELAARGIQRVVIAGLVTHGCVQSTCLDALKRGYTAVLASDGHSSYHAKAAQMIAEWNEKLSASGAGLCPSLAIEF